MIVVRKVEERPRQNAPRRLSLRGPPRAGVALDLYDLRLPPGKRIELDDRLRLELITYVVTGTLRHAVGKHTSALLAPGEFQRVALGLTQDAAHTQSNPSRSETSHVVQLLVHDPRLSLTHDHQQRRLHATALINSLGHVWGTRRYATSDGSRNNALLALLTLGEGWHNNHHHAMYSMRQGFMWWEVDFTYYTLRAAQALGVVWSVRRPSTRGLAGPKIIPTS